MPGGRGDAVLATTRNVWLSASRTVGAQTTRFTHDNSGNRRTTTA